MKIHSLKMVNVGPYTGVVEIDFDRFPDLFLIEGETGSGKTVILDSIIYALYGAIPTISGAAVEQKIRSDHVGPEDKTYVEMVFTVPSGSYLIHRSPTYERLKARGEGTTIEKPQVRLFKFTKGYSGDHTLVADKAREVGQTLYDILPLEFDQFIQTVILPQGNFANFLKANSVDRQPLLQSIFGTEMYEELQNYFRAAAGEAKANSEAQRQSTETAIATLTAATKGNSWHEQAENLFTLFDSQEFDQIEPLIEALEDEYQIALEAVVVKKQAAEKELDKANKTLQDLKAVGEKLARREKYRQNLLLLEASKAEHKQIKQRLDLANKANLVEQSRLLFLSRENEKANADSKALKALSATDFAVEEGVIPSEEQLVELVEQVKAGEVRLSELEKQAKVEAGFEAKQKQVEEQVKLSQELAEEVASAQEKIGKGKESLAKLNEEHEDLEKRFNLKKYDEAKNLVSACEKTVDAHLEISKQSKKLVTLKTKLDKAFKQKDAAEAAENEARNLWHSDLAGQLAADLQEGQACPVCGGTEHPHPATETDFSGVSKEQIEALGEKTADANATYAQAKANYDAGAQALEELKKQVEGDVDQAKAALKAAQAELDALEEADKQLQALAKKIKRAQTKQEKDAEALSQKKTELASLEVAVKNAEKELKKTAKELAEMRGDFESVALALAEQKESTKVKQKAVKAVGEAHTAQKELLRSRKEWEQQVEQNGFADAEEALAAVVPQDVFKDLTEKWETWSKDYEATKKALADDEFKDLAEDAVAPDLTDANKDLEAATRELEVQTTSVGRAKEALEGFHNQSQTVLGYLADYQKAIAGSAEILWLANLANNESKANLLETPLKNYVLSARFGQVIESANSRLRDIQSGRYQLERIESDATKRNRSHGLELGIRDFTNNQLRSVSTLSGGESFSASMALALGLADVVTSQAGGIKLGTMFIDEGFGTLSNDYLDDVLAVLERLPESGRNVGVISHVETLRQAINDQIHVRQQADKTSTIECDYS